MTHYEIAAASIYLAGFIFVGSRARVESEDGVSIAGTLLLAILWPITMAFFLLVMFISRGR